MGQTKKIKISFTPRGGIIDKGSVYVVVILTILIFGGFIFVGGTLPTKLPKVSSELVSLNISPPEPTKTGMQLYTFYGVTNTPHPTRPPRSLESDSDPQLIDCRREVTGSTEHQMIWGFTFDPLASALRAFYTNKHALVLGSGAVSPMGTHPASSAVNPAIGNTTVKDSNNFPLFPAIFITDITNLPQDISGDSQAGGQANKPDALKGTWKAAGAANPEPNGRDRGAGAALWPPANGPQGIHESDFTTEIEWTTSALSLQGGHKYRIQIVLHDGGTPSDVGQACMTFVMPGAAQAPAENTANAACTKYVAPTGSDSNAGTITAPFATLQKAHDVAVVGDTICMRGGTYTFPAETTLTRDGTSGNPIRVFNFPGELPVIDGINQPPGSGHIAVIGMTDASWWHIKGLELKNGPVQGLEAEGSSGNNIFEQLNIHHMGRQSDAGGRGTAIAIYGTGGNNLILNNDVHDNEDQLSFGGGANGINLVTSGTGNVIRGNRAWCNSDDGIDMWNAAPALIEKNWVWASGQGIDCRATGGNGHGYKLGGTYTPGRDGTENDGGHTLNNNLAWKNKESGFHENGGKLPMKLYNNTAWSNNSINFAFWNPSTTYRNNISVGNLGRITGSATYNSWTLPVTANDADFQSVDDSCTRGPRQADGSLPICGFLHLVAGSDLIDKGANVGIPYKGSAPDLGAFE